MALVLVQPAGLHHDVNAAQSPNDKPTDVALYAGRGTSGEIGEINSRIDLDRLRHLAKRAAQHDTENRAQRCCCIQNFGGGLRVQLHHAGMALGRVELKPRPFRSHLTSVNAD